MGAGMYVWLISLIGVVVMIVAFAFDLSPWIMILGIVLTTFRFVFVVDEKPRP